MIYTWHICVVSGQTQTAFKTQLEIVNFASLTANSTLKYNKEKTASNNSRVNETGLCLYESHLMLLLKLRHVHADETLRKRATESCYSPLHAQPIISNEGLFTDFTDLLNVFMHVSSHLLGQLGFTCTNSHQTFICFYAINFIKQCQCSRESGFAS